MMSKHILMHIPDLSYLEYKVFKNDYYFNYFENIDEKTESKIISLSKKFINTKFTDEKLKNYFKVLHFLNSPKGRYVANPNGHEVLFKSYDEVIMFYILCCDPNLNMYEDSIHLDYKLSKDVSKALFRKKFGFYNEYILKYEQALFLRNSKTLVTNVRANTKQYSSLLINSKFSFDDISLERFNEIKLLSDEWKKNQTKGTEFQTCLYNLFYQSNLLKLKNNAEKIVFLINCIDCELKLLTIFEEESMIQNVNKRAINELGFYDENLIRVEQLFHDKFIPDKEISEWTYQKNIH